MIHIIFKQHNFWRKMQRAITQQIQIFQWAREFIKRYIALHSKKEK
jgi:hypothetical protein